jgi:hypothetical protein
MADKKTRSKDKENKTADCSVNQIPEQVSTEISTSYKSLPPKSTNQKIHSRQVLPAIKKGKKIPDETPTPPIKIENR